MVDTSLLSNKVFVPNIQEMLDMLELGNETVHFSSTLSPRFAIISVLGEILITRIEDIRTTKHS